MTTPDQQIAALKRERAGYVARGLDDRVDQVDEELARLQADNDAGDQGPEGRSGPQSQQRTADADRGPGTGNGDAAQTGDSGAKAPAKKTAVKKTAATAPPTE